MQKNNIPEKWGNTDVSNPWGNKDSVNAEKAGGVSSNSGISLDKAGSVQNHVSETPDINGGRAVIEEPHDSVQSFEAVNPESTGSANTMKVLRVALASVMVAALLGTPLVFWLMNRQGSNDFEADNSVVENNAAAAGSENAVDNLTAEESELSEVAGTGSESSRKLMVNYLPELYDDITSDDGILKGELSNLEKNSFSICDIDSDGEAELLMKITTGSSAVNCLYIYKADSSGNVKQEGVMSSNSTFYKNGYVKSPWSHNQGKGSLWPYTVAQYIKEDDEYVNTYSLDSWDKTVNAENFPDDVDVSSKGVIYYINNFISGEKSTCDHSDYVKWFNSWNQNSPKININFEALSADNIRKYVPDFQLPVEKPETQAQTQAKTNNHDYLGRGYVNTNTDDLNLRQSASRDSNVLITIPKHTPIEIYSSDSSDWYYTSYKGANGYVSADWVAFGDPPVQENHYYLGRGYADINDGVLNLRQSASTGSSVLTTIPKYGKLDLYTSNDTGWYYTSYNGVYGYVSKDWVSFGDPPTSGRYSYIGIGYVSTNGDNLNLRQSASTSSNVLTSIPNNTRLDLYSSGSYGWYYTSYNGLFGYVSADWIDF